MRGWEKITVVCRVGDGSVIKFFSGARSQSERSDLTLGYSYGDPCERSAVAGGENVITMLVTDLTWRV